MAMYILLMRNTDPNKMSHSELHALVAREINRRLDEEARVRREREEMEAKG